jgi:hypothetical protein
MEIERIERVERKRRIDCGRRMVGWGGGRHYVHLSSGYVTFKCNLYIFQKMLPFEDFVTYSVSKTLRGILKSNNKSFATHQAYLYLLFCRAFPI